MNGAAFFEEMMLLRRFKRLIGRLHAKEAPIISAAVLVDHVMASRMPPILPAQDIQHIAGMAITETDWRRIGRKCTRRTRA